MLLLLAYAPASHLPKPLSFVVAERLLYVPCAAACLLFGAGLGAVQRRGAARRGAARAAFCMALVACAARTARRNVEWRDDEALFGSAAEAYPRSAKAIYQLADGLVQLGREAEAEIGFRRAIEIEPKYVSRSRFTHELGEFCL